MNKNEQYKQYVYKNLEILEKTKKEQEEKLAYIMKKYQPYRQPVKVQADMPKEEVKAQSGTPAESKKQENTTAEVKTQTAEPVEEKTLTNTPAKNENKQNDKNKEYQAAFNEAVELHSHGINGDKEAVKKACEIFKKLCSQDPQNRLVEAYFGSVTALMGRDAVNPNDRFKLAMKGLKTLDHAVSVEPDNIDIRSIRGHVCYRLPEMYFHRTGTAIEDFTYMISRYEEDSSCFTEEYYWQILFYLGSAYKELNRLQDAQAVWKKLLTVTSDPRYRKMVMQAGFKADGSLQKSGQPEVEAEETSWVSRPQNAETAKKKDLDEGIKLHYRASKPDSDWQDIQQAFQFFEKAYQDNPYDPVISAYYADCLSITGREAKDPPSMFSSAIKAIKIFDNAVNSSPDNIEIRLLRGIQSFRLPESFFKRTATAVTDFEYLIRRYEQDNTTIPKEFYWKTLYLLGKAYQRLDMEKEARAVWQKLLDLGSNPEYNDLLMDELTDMPIENSLPADMPKMSKKELFDEGLRLHDLAAAGNKKATRKAYELLKKVYEANPDDPVVEGYYGSSLALVGRDSNDSQVMFNNAIEGMQHLKRAVLRDSSNPKLRLLRAYLLYNLPESFFHMSEKAAKDFRALVSAYDRDNSIFSEECYWQILYDLGVCYERLNDKEKAGKVWKKLMKISADPKYRSLLNKKIEGSDNK